MPFWDAETSDGLLNRYGGQLGASLNATLGRTASAARSGNASLEMILHGTLPVGGSAFVQSALGPVGAVASATQGRNLARFDATDFYIRNDTGSPFTLKFEVKDDRDSNAHAASRSYAIDPLPGWQPVHVPLDLAAPGWSVSGSPDLSRAGRFSYIVQANRGASVAGSVLIDDAVFIEPGGAVDVATAPISVIAQRLARRQFDGMWSARHRATGLIPLHNTSNGTGAMNTTSAVLKMLPGAVQRGWVPAADADQYVTTLVGSLNTMLDNGVYLPPRYVHTSNLQPLPGVGGEESSIDAAFMALALHQYKNSAGVSPALAQAVDEVQNRFNFAPLSDTTGGTRGWKFAYRSDTGLTDGTYNGYSSEPWLISLAAALGDDHRVPIETQWNSGIFRSKQSLVDDADEHLTHSFTQFRAPFVQWLLPMFADTRDRGHDTYPILSVAGNPHDNASAYQRDVDAFFASIGRELFLQPDAGDNGAGSYRQFSAYNDFGDDDLFMPWSATLALMGDPDAEAALRHHLANDLEGPLGLADSARWATGANEPGGVRAFLDFWNTALSTMALVEMLYGEAGDFAQLAEVSAALDTVFHLAGDYNQNGQVEQGDLDLVLQNWGQDTAAGVPTGWLNDRPRGQIEQTELDRVLQNWGSAEVPDFGTSAVPEPVAGVWVGAWVLLRRRRGWHGWHG